MKRHASAMFSAEHLSAARALLEALRTRPYKFATAESCTGGLIAALVTAIPGSSDVFEGGFVVYSNAAKIEILGVPRAIIDTHGAVSEPTARAMAEGAIKTSAADLSVSVTGVAGPGGGTPVKPVGMVCFAVAIKGQEVRAETHQFGDIGRESVREASVLVALKLAMKALDRITS